jgi:hypothetical protein
VKAVTNFDHDGVVPPPDPVPVEAWHVPDDPPPGRRGQSGWWGRSGWWVLVAVVVLGLVAGVAELAVSRGGEPRNETAPVTVASPAEPVLATSPAAPQVVVYVVESSGKADVGSVEYTDQDGDIIRHSGVPLPWRVTFTMSGERRPLVLIAQRKKGGTGAVSCSITYAGKVLATATETGAYAAPLCSA